MTAASDSTGVPVPFAADGLRAAVAQLAVAERLRSWSVAAHAANPARIELEITSVGVVLRPYAPLGATSETALRVPTAGTGPAQPRAFSVRLDRLVDAVQAQPADADRLTLRMDATDVIVTHERASRHSATARLADPLHEVVVGAIERGDTLPLPLAWGLRALALPAADRDADPLLRAVLVNAAATLNARAYDFFIANQLPRWVEATGVVLEDLAPTDATEALRTATETLKGDQRYRTIDLDAMAIVALGTAILAGDARHPPVFLRQPVPVATIRLMLGYPPADADLLPSERTRVAAASGRRDVLAVGALLRAAPECDLEGLTAPLPGGDQHPYLEKLAAGAFREQNSSYSLTLRQMPSAARAAVLLAANHEAAPARLAFLDPDDAFLARTLAPEARTAAHALGADGLDRVAWSLLRSDATRRDNYFTAPTDAHAALKTRDLRPTAYVPASLAGGWHSFERPLGATPLPAARGRAKANDSEAAPLWRSGFLPSPDIGIIATTLGAPVIWHPPSGAALVRTENLLLTVRPSPSASELSEELGQSAGGRSARTDRSVPLVPLNGAELVLAVAAQRSANRSRAPDAPLPIALQFDGEGLLLRFDGGGQLRLFRDRWARSRTIRAAGARAFADLERLHAAPPAVLSTSPLTLYEDTLVALERGIREIRATRRVRDPDDLREGVEPDEVVAQLSFDPLTGFLAVDGGSAAGRAAAVNVTPHATLFNQTGSALLMDADALATALSLLRGLSAEDDGHRTTVSIAAESDPRRPSLLLRRGDRAAVIRPWSPAHHTRREPASTDSRAADAVLARVL